MASTTRKSNSSILGSPEKDRNLKIGGVLAAATVAGAGILYIAFRDDSSEKVSSPETTTSVPATTTTTPQLEPFSFTVGDKTYACEIAQEPHIVTGGEDIWQIVEEQQVETPTAHLWKGMVELNQSRNNLGANPNLIYRGNEIDVLINCR